jgi:hypothetical protein
MPWVIVPRPRRRPRRVRWLADRERLTAWAAAAIATLLLLAFWFTLARRLA